MQVVATIEGIPQARRKLETFTVQVQKDLEEVLDVYAFLIQRLAQELAPVDTGFLRNNIYVEFLDRFIRLIKATASYAVFQELGTRFMPAQPFLVPAANRYRVEFRRSCQQAIEGSWRRAR